MEKPGDPVRTADESARKISLALLQNAGFAALSYIDASSGLPAISRVAIGTDAAGVPVTLISALSAHFQGLTAHPECALMVGEPGPKGDPLTHPRLMIQARAEFVAPDDPDRPTLRTRWLKKQPKAKLYIDFTDFAFVRLTPTGAMLNGGFGKAFRLAEEDLHPD